MRKITLSKIKILNLTNNLTEESNNLQIITDKSINNSTNKKNMRETIIQTVTDEKMMEIAGYTINEKGYRILPEHIRLIYGDGINPQSINDILSELKFRQISADNIAFGMGGALLQHINRDTLHFAMKINATSQDGNNWTPVSKNPITDPSKRSKHGRLALIKTGSSYKTIPLSELHTQQNKLVPIFRNGEILKEIDFNQIRLNVLES